MKDKISYHFIDGGKMPENDYLLRLILNTDQHNDGLEYFEVNALSFMLFLLILH